MIKLIRITSTLILLAGFFILNIYFFARALEFSKIYPFKRALIGNTLTVNIDITESSLKFKSKIIKIEGEDADNNNVSGLLIKHARKSELNVTLDTEGRIINKTIIKNEKNNDYLLFLIP